MLKDLVLRNRSYRKYHAEQMVSDDLLTSLIDLARITPSSKNKQPLRYIVVREKKETDFVFGTLKWAKHLTDWDGPSVAERPPAYIVMLLDKSINKPAMIDAGIAAQTILLGAVEKGLGGCIVRTVNRPEIEKYYQLPDHLEIIQVIALGFPNQEVSLTDVGKDGNTEYFEDENSIHWVPKRSLDEIILKVEPHYK